MTVQTIISLVIAVVLAVGALETCHEAAWASLRLLRVPTSLDSPVFATNARDGSHRLFVVELGGVIKVLQPGSTSPTVFLHITSKVLAAGDDQGLLGLTFHPQFSTNRRFFVNYTRDPDGATVVAEYKASVGDSNVADPTETVLLVIPHTDAFHNAGMIEFGPDGFLYIGTGDGGHPDRAQDIAELHGKILRINVDVPNPPQVYSSPPSNPFFGPTAGADEIYAYGFRNPWRFSFDRDTGDLYAGDVGHSAVEEIDIVTLGGNYGWWIWEASSCSGFDPPLCTPGGYIFPILEYGHTVGRCAIIGGYVYRGTQGTLPLGSYLSGDLCSGEIFALQSGTVSVALQATALNITSFGEDESGEVYVVGFGADTGLHRLVDIPSTTERDFNVDARADILWRNANTGSIAVWLLDGTSLTGSGIPGGATADWQIAGVGDFNGDGRADVLWRHNTGTVAVWLLDGTSVIGSGVPGTAGADWQIVSVGDFNGDGKADILWRSSVTGTHAMWMLNGTSILWSGTLTPNSRGAGWQVVGVGDFNGDGRADILWRHDSGTVAVWLLNGTNLIGAGVPGTAGADWHIVGVGDFNGDDRVDILWRHDSGTVNVWLLDGVAIIGSGGLGAAGVDWQIQ